MSLSQLLVKELQHEAVSTRKILAIVPDGHVEWRPHEKSFTLGRLASHVAELPQWMNRILDADDYDMAAHPYAPNNCTTNKELLELFEEKLQLAIASLEKATDEELQKEWIFRRGEHVVTKGTKYESLRSWMLNHQVHHRGQLSVYLRLLDVPLPGMYGPSADDVIARKKAAEANS